MQILTNSPEETQVFGRELSTHLKPGIPICLYGDLGSGKTNLVKGIALGLGISDLITSPTFTLIKMYQGNKKTLCHIDLYRINAVKELREIGILDLIRSTQSCTIIEWAEKLGDYLPKKRVDIKIDLLEGSKRKFSFTPNLL